jgi:hypothetical protein
VASLRSRQQRKSAARLPSLPCRPFDGHSVNQRHSGTDPHAWIPIVTALPKAQPSTLGTGICRPACVEHRTSESANGDDRSAVILCQALSCQFVGQGHPDADRHSRCAVLAALPTLDDPMPVGALDDPGGMCCPHRPPPACSPTSPGARYRGRGDDTRVERRIARLLWCVRCVKSADSVSSAGAKLGEVGT